MKKAAVAMVFFAFVCISTNSFASDIFGYWKSEEKPPFDYIQLTDRVFKFNNGKMGITNIIRIGNADEKKIIYFVDSMYKISDEDWKKISTMSDAEIGKFASKIICTLTDDSMLVTTGNNRTIKYSRATEEEGRRILAD